MILTRRAIMQIGAGAAVAAGLTPFMASAKKYDDALAEFTGGAEVIDGEIELTTPEIAENGNTVPVSVAAPGAAMIAIFADGNPEAEVAVFTFGPLAGSQAASTRIRLAQTQNVIAVAQMGDGSFRRVAREVKVTIGGCGG
ncbi:thiosulfate oxidation carrier protein SoxY [Halovulum dunhuangense]|uniref:Thiosulfate oxidation carrier protein SoxY n=1 Tax=Halovulum dunhuangense TaxID=1505036 RepID=A0A849L057_9RHOB|nr:thiosulfate oxidation carrier protein SoxY [Halovulum dunhuangense]NNU79250.1 thiosulfate oxidation carrier protein SoxY [Halovulum dunhuangense]